MHFKATKLRGAFLVELDPRRDERGSFARTYCEKEFAARELCTRFPQCNLSRNPRAFTLRGMHYQAPPHDETKLVRCVSGAIHDVIVDLRPASPTYLQWLGVELSAETGAALYVPAGCAHGFLTLTDDTDVFYQMGSFHAPEAARGFRWNDPRLRIAWPREPVLMSDRDRTYPDLEPAGSAR